MIQAGFHLVEGSSIGFNHVHQGIGHGRQHPPRGRLAGGAGAGSANGVFEDGSDGGRDVLPDDGVEDDAHMAGDGGGGEPLDKPGAGVCFLGADA